MFSTETAQAAFPDCNWEKPRRVTQPHIDLLVGFEGQTYESGGVGAVNTKDLDGGLDLVGGGRGKSAHGGRDEASGSGDAGAAENLAGEHGEEAERRN